MAEKIIENIDKQFNTVEKHLDDQMSNPVVMGVLQIVLVLYAGLVAPELPQIVKNIFDNKIGKILFIAMIAFIANKNATIAILLAIVYIITLDMLKTETFAQELID
tara:strand:+ start:6164 stop:6481 length:318 start_codon:yes stop_codon:yes gene_type:complete